MNPVTSRVMIVGALVFATAAAFAVPKTNSATQASAAAKTDVRDWAHRYENKHHTSAVETKPHVAHSNVQLNRKQDSFFDKYIAGRLSVGVRYSSISLDDTERPPDRESTLTFLGNINHLKNEEESNFYPVLGYQFLPWLAANISYGKVRASTWNFNNGATDGDVEMSGPLIMARFQLPLLEGTLYPFAELGYAPWSTKFIHDAQWYHGGWREMTVDDDGAFVFALGAAYRPWEHFELGLSWRKMEITAPAKYYKNWGSNNHELRRVGEFTLENTAICVTASYIF